MLPTCRLEDRVRLSLAAVRAWRSLCRGAHVVLAGRHSNTLDAVADQVCALGRESLSVVTDVTDRKQVVSLVDATMAQFGRVDILVNNASETRGSLTPVVESRSPAAASGCLRTDVVNHCCCITRAVNNLTESLAAELAGYHVRVNAIAPDPIGVREASDAEREERAARSGMLVRRLGSQLILVQRPSIWLRILPRFLPVSSLMFGAGRC